MTRIVSVAEFDAADVLAGHRRAIRALGHDYHLIVRDAYTTRAAASFDVMVDDVAHDDFIAHARDLIRRADVIQLHPSIGQPWSSTSLAPFFGDRAAPIGEGKHTRLLGDAVVSSRARKLALFHGSRNAAANAELYAEHWRAAGYEIAATTLDYVARMQARYMPPALYPPEGTEWPRAPLRTEDDPLVIAHAPTDRKNCQTAEFLAAARTVGAVVDVIERRPWPEVIARKARCNAGFDHLRGSFSVNTLENCAIGLVPLVCVWQRYNDMLAAHGFERMFEGIATPGQLPTVLRNLNEHPGAHADLQQYARDWFNRHWTPDAIGRRLEATYMEILKGSATHA